MTLIAMLTKRNKLFYEADMKLNKMINWPFINWTRHKTRNMKKIN